MNPNSTLQKVNLKRRNNGVLSNNFFKDAIIPIMLPEIADLETEAVSCFHWHIQDWKSLESRCHSPTFELHGFEWFVFFSVNFYISC